jgi:hypothetical protein
MKERNNKLSLVRDSVKDINGALDFLNKIKHEIAVH